MHFGFMNVMLLHNDDRHISVNHVATFGVARAIVQIFVMCRYYSAVKSHIDLVKIPVKL
jgi:hypothetical protein